jgi:pyridoxamine 5'-phosphate oxidase
MKKNSGDILRNKLISAPLDEKLVEANPFRQFESWFLQAERAEIMEHNAMFLATAGKSGRPSGRVVLLKGFDERGFVFFTNYESRKGEELAENPFAALTFHWKELERQVRIEGKVSKVSAAESDAYFLSRPAESRISALSSPQSKVIPGRSFLEERWNEFDSLTSFSKRQRPAFWGGFRLKPDVIEFWQGRPHRLHDRIRYTKTRKAWITERLAP